MLLRSLILGLVVICINANVSSEPVVKSKVDNETNMVSVKIKVVEYIVNAMRDSYEDGREVVFDATRCEVVSSKIDVGKELLIYHDQPSKKTSFWRNIGEVYNISIEKEDLVGAGQLFSGAITNLEK